MSYFLFLMSYLLNNLSASIRKSSAAKLSPYTLQFKIPILIISPSYRGKLYPLRAVKATNRDLYLRFSLFLFWSIVWMSNLMALIPSTIGIIGIMLSKPSISIILLPCKYRHITIALLSVKISLDLRLRPFSSEKGFSFSIS